MNILNRTIHPVLQGTGAWLSLRDGHDTASEAPAALGVSLYQTRAALLRAKHTGLSAEHSPATLGKFAAGHAAEADARPLAEAMVGEDLFPVTMTADVDGLRLLASLDGQTMDGREIWETKLWNESLAAAVRVGAHALHEHYRVQMDQQLLVSGALRCLFTVTDGSAERFVWCWYYPQPERFAALLAGWKQFHADLAAYTLPPDSDPAPVGRAPETLPALRIEVSGAVTASNLAEFRETALAAIRSVNRNLRTDQDFSDAERAAKWCAEVEQRLEAAKQHALSQTASIDALFRAIDDISAEARRVRLDLDKLVTSRKAAIKEARVMQARKDLDEYLVTLNERIAPARLQPVVSADWAGAIKGLRSLDSLQDALDSTLARAKADADVKARAIIDNLSEIRSRASDFLVLFPDLAELLHKDRADFAALVEQRIAAHRKAFHAAQAAAAPPPASFPEAEDEPAILRLGTICERLGVQMTAEFVGGTLNVKPAKVAGAAKLYTEAQYQRICAALISHTRAMALLYAPEEVTR